MENTQQKIEKMNEVLTKMEDIKETQQRLLEKLGKVEVSLYDFDSENLDKELDKIMTHSSNSFDIINEAIEDFEMKRNRIKNEA